MNTESRGLHVHAHSSFFEMSRFVRFLIIFGVSLGIFLFLQYKDSGIPKLEVGTIAYMNIVAPISFKAVDESATEIAFAAHIRETGPLYLILKEDIAKRQQELETDLVQKPQWRNVQPAIRFEDISQGISTLGNVLQQVRFSSPKASKEYREFFGTAGLYFPIGISDPIKGICFTDSMLNQIQEILLKRYQMKPQIAKYLADGLREKIWFLHEATPAKARWCKFKRQHFPAQYNHFPVGSTVISRGEIVTTEHKNRLEGLRNGIEQQNRENFLIGILGNVLLTVLMVFSSIVFLRNYFPSVTSSNLTCLLIGSIVLLAIFWAKLFEIIMLHLPSTTIDFIHYPILVPGMGMLLCILVNPMIAIFLTVIGTIVMGMGLVFDIRNFMLINLLVSFICIFYTRALRRRAEIVVVCFRGLLVAAALTLALCLLSTHRGIGLWIQDVSISGMFMLITSVAIIGLLPIFESLFHVLTDINLMEFMNSNNPLLKRLMQEAPGTYQHSLLLGSLSEAAATAIGCDGLFCRVATLYHDIGKVCISQYFSENQETGINIHQLLTPAESAKVIISHVQEGVNLARREGLPEAFLDVIKEHHGTSLVYYFYHKQLEACGNDPSKVCERDFRYLGPKPHSKEAAIVMIADSFEAACRSLEEINEANLTKLIDQIVREKIDDGQFDECSMRFEELTKIKKALVKSILSIGHFRIKYPSKKINP